MADALLKYKVKPGFVFGDAGQFKAGDIVELTEQQASGFLDKLELADPKVVKVLKEALVEPAPEKPKASRKK